MTNAAISLELRLCIGAVGRVANVTFRVRGNRECRLLRRWFMAGGAFQFLAVSQRVLVHMIQVLLAIEVSVEIFPRGKVTLRRTRSHRLFLTMTNGASLQRTLGELRDVAFDASLVSGEVHLQTLVVFVRCEQGLTGNQPLVASVAFQLARLLRTRQLDRAGMGFMREAAVINFFLRVAARP